MLWPRSIFVLRCGLAGLCLLLGLSQAAQAEDLYVQVSTAAVRASPQQWAKALTSVRYGDTVTVVEAVSRTDQAAPGWLKVRRGSIQGFLHRSAVTDRRVVIRGRGATPGVSNAVSDDIVLAGKGFNDKVEGAYRARGAGTNYPEVDRMLARTVSDAEVATFVTSGKLGGRP